MTVADQFRFGAYLDAVGYQVFPNAFTRTESKRSGDGLATFASLIPANGLCKPTCIPDGAMVGIDDLGNDGLLSFLGKTDVVSEIPYGQGTNLQDEKRLVTGILGHLSSDTVADVQDIEVTAGLLDQFLGSVTSDNLANPKTPISRSSGFPPVSVGSAFSVKETLKPAPHELFGFHTDTIAESANVCNSARASGKAVKRGKRHG